MLEHEEWRQMEENVTKIQSKTSEMSETVLLKIVNFDQN